LPSFGSVHRNPSDTGEIELRPAMITGYVAFCFSFRQWETDFEASWNSGRPHHANKKGMKIGAVATLRGTRPYGVASAPSFAGLVIAHGSDDVIVDVTGFLNWRGITGGMLPGKLGDRAGERNYFVGLQVALQIRLRRD